MVDTTEGIRIDLVDDADFSMFRLGTTVLTARGSGNCCDAIAEAVGPRTAALTMRGHTDALPWRRGRAPATTGRSPPAAPRRPARRCCGTA